MMNMMHDEHVSAFSSPMKNAAPARWQRKRALADHKAAGKRRPAAGLPPPARSTVPTLTASVSVSSRAAGGAGDRFIPHRSAMDFNGSNFELTKVRWPFAALFLPFQLAVKPSTACPLARQPRLAFLS